MSDVRATCDAFAALSPPNRKTPASRPSTRIAGTTPRRFVAWQKRHWPVRTVNEYVYCPRLTYLEWVQGECPHQPEFSCGRHTGAPIAWKCPLYVHITRFKRSARTAATASNNDMGRSPWAARRVRAWS